MARVNVTKKNFISILPMIKDCIDQAAFISIDSEFTGLNINNSTKSSLFDSAEQRYLKARLNVQAIALAQFGLTAYVSVGANRYDAYMYNFYLFPEAIGGIDTRFTMQASSVQFLTQYKFDFNKMMYEGISFLNKSQENRLKDYLRANSGFSSNLTDAHQALLRKYCSKIARWLIHAKEDDVFTLEKHLDDGEVELSNEVLHRILINRIDNIWPQPSADNVLIVEKVSPSRRAELMEHWSVEETDYEKSLESYRGFTNVIDHVIKKKKVMVGHNLYLDLMLIYDKFIDYLPKSYQEYKERLHSCFPHIYDTKYMALQLRKEFDDTVHSYDATSLSELHVAMADPKCTTALLFPPTVAMAVSHIKDDECRQSNEIETDTLGNIHEAGYDSYMCGLVFLRLAHLVTINKLEPALSAHPISFYDYEHHIAPFKNHVNLIRATLHNICLDGADPEHNRTDRLFIKAKKSALLRPEEVSFLLSSYGAVDISKISQNKAVVIVSNQICARRILEAFQSHDKYAVVRYNPWRHSILANRILWTGAILSAGICTLALIRNVKKQLLS